MHGAKVKIHQFMQNFIIVLYVMPSDTCIIGVDINLHSCVQT
jgi:hypothetical protein